VVPLQNRVTPFGQVIATPERGLVFGNRGCLHDEHGTIRRAYSTKRWIACRLEFRGRRRSPLMAPGRYTELFFLDEATALAAGHRPCAECRRVDYVRLGEIWADLHPGQHGADAIDAQLHSERLHGPGRERLDGPRLHRRLHEMGYAGLPDGVFVRDDGRPCLVLGARLLGWSPRGYLPHRRRPARGPAAVITPPSLVAVLESGWTPVVPLLHPTAQVV
jgi:hypothetical protein